MKIKAAIILGISICGLAQTANDAIIERALAAAPRQMHDGATEHARLHTTVAVPGGTSTAHFMAPGS